MDPRWGVPGIGSPGLLLPGYSAPSDTFTLDAIVAGSASGTWSLDAIVSAPAAGSFTLNAQIAHVVGAGLALDAVVSTTLSWSCGLDAVIAAPASGGFTFDAELIRPAWVLLNAMISVPRGGSCTFDAIVVIRSFSDDFERTVTQGLGGNWVWSNDDSWPSVSPSTALASVDGHEAILPPYGSSASYESYRGFPDLPVGLVVFDFWVPASPTDSYTTYGFQFASHNVYVEAQGNETFGLRFDWSALGSAIAPVTPSTWYRAKFWVDVTGQMWRGKVWPRDGAEPDWQAAAAVSTTYGAWQGVPYLDFYYSPAAEAARLDNISFWAAAPWTTLGGFALNAVIPYYGGSFTFQALIIEGAPAPVAWVGTTAAEQSASNAITVPEPTGLLAGDVEILRISWDAQGNFSWGWSTSWVGNQWAILAFDELSNGDQALLTMWRRYTPGSTSVTFALTKNGVAYNGSIAAVLSAYRNVLSVERSVSTQSITNSRTHTSEDIVTDLPNTLVEAAWSEDVGPGATDPYWVGLTSGWTPLPLADTTRAALLVAYNLFPAGDWGPASVDFIGAYGDQTPTQIRTVYLIGPVVSVPAPSRNVILGAWIASSSRGVFLLAARIDYALTLSACVCASPHASLALNACIRRPAYQAATLDAWISGPSTHAWSLTFDALIFQRGFSLDAWIVLAAPWPQSGSAPFNAVIWTSGIRGYADLDAFIDAWHQSGSTTLAAWIVGTQASMFLDAQISVPTSGAGATSLDAAISSTYHTAASTLDAWTQATVAGVSTLAAVIGPTHLLAYTLDAYVPTYVTLDAFVIGTVGRAFTLDARVPAYVTLNAVIEGHPGSPDPYPAGYGTPQPMSLPGTQISSSVFQVSPLLSVRPGVRLDLDFKGLVWPSGLSGVVFGFSSSFSSGIGPTTTTWSYTFPTGLGAPRDPQFGYIYLGVGTLGGSATYTLSAFRYPPLGLTLDAIVAAAGFTPARGFVSFDATILAHQAGGCTFDAYIPGGLWPLAVALDAEIRYLPRLTLVAIIGRATGGSCGLDAVIGAALVFGAWIGSAPAVGAAGSFGLDAFIWRPPWTSGPGGQGYSFGPGSAPKHQVKITIDGVDVTANTVWALTSFTQVARTGPGTFTLALRGAADAGYEGGEDVKVEIDGFTVFGGLCLQVERGFFFPDYPEAKLVLHGTDYNIVSDKLVLWNRANTVDEGAYRPIPDLPKGTSDRAWILKAARNWMQFPSGFTVGSGVESISSPNPDTNGSTANGISWREFMQGITVRTEGVFWWDAHKAFQYHPRDVVSAPFGITDDYHGGAGMVGCRDLSLTTDITNMVTDDIVWGVMGHTVKGEVIWDHESGASPYGFWQWAEYRSDVRTKTHVQTRAKTAIARYGQPVAQASCTIFEPGLQAGQVVTVESTAYGRSDNLVLRQMTIRFIGQTPVGGVMGGVPQFDLVFGLDPETPWNIYDALPFDQVSFTDIPAISIEIPHISFWQGGLPARWSCEDCTIVLVESFLDKLDGAAWGTPDYMPTGSVWTGTGTISGLRGVLNGQTVNIGINLTPPPACFFAMAEFPASGGYVLVEFGDQQGYYGTSHDSVTLYANGSLSVAVLASPGPVTLNGAIDPKLVAGPFFLRIYFDQQSISVRVWPTNLPEPTAWTYVGNVAGAGCGLASTLTVMGSVTFDFLGLALCPGQIANASLGSAPDGLALVWDNEWSYWNEFDPSGNLIYYAIPGSLKSFSQTITPWVNQYGTLSASASGSYWWNNAPIWGNSQHKPWPYEPFSFVSRQIPIPIPKGTASVEGTATVSITRPNSSYVASTTVWPIGFEVGRGTYDPHKNPALGLLEQEGGSGVVEVTHGYPGPDAPPTTIHFGPLTPDPGQDWIPITLELRTVLRADGNYVGLGDVDDSRPDAPYANPGFEWWVGSSFLFGGGLNASAVINMPIFHTDPAVLLTALGIPGINEWDLTFHRAIADSEGWGCETLSVDAKATVHTSRPFGDGTVTVYDMAGNRFDDWQVVDETHIEMYGATKGDVFRVSYMGLRTDQLRSQPRSPKTTVSNTFADKLRFGDRLGKF